MGRRGDRLARSGAADRAGHGARDAARRLAGPRLGADGRLGDAPRAPCGRPWRRVATTGSDNLIGDPRHEPARPARSHDARVGRRRVPRRARRRSAGAPSRSTATTSPRSTRPTATAEDGRRADDDRRAHREGPRRLVPGQRRGLARQGVVGGAGGEQAIDELGGVRDLVDHAAQARVVHRHGARAASRGAPAPAYDEAHRRRARRSARPSRGSPRPARTLVVLDGEVGNSTLHRGLPGGRARAVLRGLHRRAGDGRRAGRACRRWARTAFAATFGAFYTRAYGLRADGGHQPREPPAVRLARRRLDRRGRPVADGARGPRDDAGACTARPCCIRPTATRTVQLVTRHVRPRRASAYMRTTREKTPHAVRTRRGVPGRGIKTLRVEPRRSRDAGRRRRHAVRVPGAAERSRARGSRRA